MKKQYGKRQIYHPKTNQPVFLFTVCEMRDGVCNGTHVETEDGFSFKGTGAEADNDIRYMDKSEAELIEIGFSK